MRHAMILCTGLLMLATVGCSKDKDDCRAVASAIFTAHGAFQDLKSAAQHGDRPKFEKAKQDLDHATAALASLQLHDGSSLQAKVNRAHRDHYVQSIAGAEKGYGELLAAVEKDPKLGEKYSGGVPPVDSAYENDVDRVEALAKTISCPK